MIARNAFIAELERAFAAAILPTPRPAAFGKIFWPLVSIALFLVLCAGLG